jgi:Ca2+-binding RTX toxin-like protein
LYSGYGSDVLHGGRGDDSLYGEQNADQLFGDDGNDRLYGGYEADELYGGSGNDELYGQEDGDRLAGGAGNDYLDGGTGADNMIGGVGNDTYFVDNAKDVIDDQGAATDQDTVIVMATITYKLGASVENAELKDVSGAASLTGNTLNNELTGNSSKNTLDGGIGKDVIYAGAGEDTLIGGAGADQLSLGQDTSVDMLVYRAVSESLAGERDRISQFMSKQDKLGLSDMDANSQMAGDQAFAFNGTTAKANAVWYQAAEVDGNKATPDLIVYADVNGDGKADFEVGMVGVAKLAQVDFVL